MALMDEFKQERESVKHKTLRQKSAYFWDYYKWHVLVLLIIITFISSSIYRSLTTPDMTLNGILLNTFSDGTEDSAATLVEDFMKTQNLDTSKCEITLDTSLFYTTSTETDIVMSNYEAIQVILAQSSTGELDFIAGDENAMIDLAYKEYLADLTDILTSEQLALYEPYLLYVDWSIVEKIELAGKNNEDSSKITLPDPRNPESMEEPIPVLIDVSNSKKLTEVYNYPIETLFFGVINMENKDMTLEFLEFIFK